MGDGQNNPVKVTTIHVFSGNDGAGPSLETLTQGENGNLYGTTITGSLSKLGGTFFQMTPSGSLTVLHVFSGFDGWQPVAGLTLGSDGLFYGDTRSRGSYFPNDGTIFSMASDGTFNLLAILDDRFTNPSATLIQGADGNYYGTSPGKGGDITPGSVFEVNSAGNLKLLHLSTGIKAGRTRSPALSSAMMGHSTGRLPMAERFSVARFSACHLQVSYPPFTPSIGMTAAIRWAHCCWPMTGISMAQLMPAAQGITALSFR
jgi:hypothetical protein